MNKCQICKERYLGCHDYCGDYQKLKKERERANKNARQMNSSIGWDGYLKVKEKNRR